MYNDLISFIKDTYPSQEIIPLHEPRFIGNESKYLEDAIKSSYVSSVGPFVNEFEDKLAKYLNVNHVILTINGTSALHISLKLLGANSDTEVLTQSLTFVASSNAIHYCNSHPIFIDIDRKTLGLSKESLQSFLEKNCYVKNDNTCWNKNTNRRIVACLPMHTFGFASEIDEIKKICDKFCIELIEDAAESMGSFYKDIHLGNFGKLGVLSFNGNKIITSGNGGAIITNNDNLARRARHITTTARLKNSWHIEHDEVGYNYRMSNINAAVGLAQLENIEFFLKNKRSLSQKYIENLKSEFFDIFRENQHSRSNYWLNVLIACDKKERDSILKITNDQNILTRPAWTPMHLLPMNKNSIYESLKNTEFIFDRMVNLPSSVTSE